MGSSDIESIPHFVKVSPLVQKLNVGHTRNHTDSKVFS
jgi:hypothetical protein